jgi:PAS domain S-box-containing protein
LFSDHEKYRQILESMPDGLYILDRQLIVHYMNPAIVQMVEGFKLNADLVGKKFTDVLPGGMAYMQDEIDCVYDTRKPLHVEHTIDVGIKIITYETVRIPLFDRSGEVTGVLNATHDITNHLAIRKELQQSRRMFETMVDNANSVILRIDLDGRITYLNRFAETFFGYSREEMMGRSVQETIIPEIDSEGKVLRQLMKDIVDNPAKYASNENENIKKDGTRVWLSWSNKPIFDDTGNAKEILCVGNDITALKNAQRDLASYRDRLEEQVESRTQELRESESRYRFLFEESPAGALVMGPGGVIQDISSSLAESLGYSRREIIGRTAVSFVVEEEREEQIQRLARRYKNEQTEQVEVRVLTRDGSVRTILFSAGQAILHEKDRPDSVLVTGIDITDRKEAEALIKQREQDLLHADKMASLGVLVSGVAHEINNPNNFIILNADNLVDIWKEVLPILDRHAAEEPGLKVVGLPYTVLRGEMDHLIEGIREGARRIRTIVTHLKDFARQSPVDMDREVDCAQVVEAARVIVSNTLKKCTGRFGVTVEPDLPHVKGDFQKLEQVVINLLSNACQALTDRNQAVTITLEQGGAGTVRMVVSDEGRGIPPEHLPLIFDPFFTTRRDSGGTGLGLSISYGIIKDHKGTMEVKSEVGKGTVFTITLPVYSTERK